MEIFVYLFIVAPLLALIPAVIADRKGHSFGLWWLFGWFFSIIFLPVVFFIEDRSGTKCPQCAEWTKRGAKKCRFCGAVLTAGGADLTAESGGVSFWPRTWIEFFIIALVLSVMVYFAVSIYRAG